MMGQAYHFEYLATFLEICKIHKTLEEEWSKENFKKLENSINPKSLQTVKNTVRYF